MRNLLWLALAGCVEPSLNASVDAISHPTQVGAHPSVGRLTVHGPGGYFQGCHFALIAPFWAITAAHCFEDVEPWAATVVLAGVQIAPGDVYFHPDTYNGQTGWTSQVWSADAPYDLALVRLPASTGLTPAKLWSPDDPMTALAVNQLVTITGSNNGFEESDQDAIGTLKVLGLRNYTTGWMIEADNAPSGMQPGDSGGGVFITASAAPALYSNPCARAAAGSGEPALLGINKAGSSTFDIVPLYLPWVADWINSFTDNDRDDDLACDAVDNCADKPNSDQANANAIAEVAPAWDGLALGDVCDPTPSAVPSLLETTFVTATSSGPIPHGDAIVTTSWGRSIRDRLEIAPLLADGSSTTSSVRVRFCNCADATGAPLPLETCKQAPYYCKLDPAQLNNTEIGAGAPSASQTYWRRITLDSVVNPATSLTYPGATAVRTWAYQTDYQKWLAAGWVTAKPLDPKYGPGTDLGGWLWTHDSTTKGKNAHGGDANPADVFAQVAPDPRSSWSNATRIPRYKPAPWFSYCGMCGEIWRMPGEDTVNPPPFLTFDAAGVLGWDRHGGFDATAYFDDVLHKLLVKPTSLLVGASEPLALAAGPAVPRQIVIASDGTKILGGVVRGRKTFELTALAGTGPSARRGFAVAWSRTANALFVVGGTSPTGAPLADAWTWRPGGTFKRAKLDKYTPTNVEAAVYAPHDRRMWLIDRSTAGRRIVRLEPLTGVVDSVGTLPAGADLESVYLVTTGKSVLLVGGIGENHRIVRLAVTPFSTRGTVIAAARSDGAGAPTGQPNVANGKLALAVARRGVTAWFESLLVAIP